MEFAAKFAIIAVLPPDMVNFRTVLLSLAALTACSISVEASPRRNAAVIVNVAAVDWAAALIAEGRFVADKKGAWSNHHPMRSRENEFVRNHGFMEYAKWHLGLDERYASGSKARYKFPFGDFQNVHRSGLLAIKSRAREFGYDEIEAAAAKLLAMIESTGPRAQKRVD